MPEAERPIPFANMVYVGDGMTDVPSMALTKKSGGHTVAVFDPKSERQRAICVKLLDAGRADFIAAADYRKSSKLSRRCRVAARRHHRGRGLPARGLRGAPGEPRAQMSALTFLALRRLADGHFHSGQDIARSLNRSRATLSEALKRAPDLGVSSSAFREGLQARRADRVPRRVPDRLAIEGDGRARDAADRRRDRVDQHAPAAARPGRRGLRHVPRRGVAARRARAARALVGVEPRGSLTFSLLWRFDRGAGHLGGLSLAVGEAVARALTESGVERVQVKWRTTWSRISASLPASSSRPAARCRGRAWR